VWPFEGASVVLRRGEEGFPAPENQKADPFSRIRPESFDDLRCSCFCRDYSVFSTPLCFPKPGEKAMQTESFEYRERSGHRAGHRVNAVSPGRRFFCSTSTTRTCQGTTKKHSTQNTQFARLLFLFLLLKASCSFLFLLLALRVTLFVFVAHHKECRACASFCKLFINSELEKSG